jgi:hypothetical protein
METDASDGVIAGVLLQQEKDLQWHPVAFYSKTMIEAELNYPIHDKEMLAIVSGFLHWRVELESTYDRIEVVSDHKALEYFMTTKALTARQARWAEVLSRYYFRIMYKPGATNQADALTRREQDTDPQRSVTAAFRNQTLLQPEQLDPQILDKLDLAPDLCEIGSPEPSPEPVPESGLDLIDDLLQANCTTVLLQS